MTPMIDVVFLLLIYFVCTASFQPLEQSLRTPLAIPSGGAGAQPVDVEIEDFEPIVVKAQREQGSMAWFIGEAACQNLGQVAATLRALHEVHSDLPVILDIGAEVPLGEVVGLYDVCWVSGYRKIQFATSVPLGPASGLPPVP